jgi:gamma-glutamyltranspeptidase/glutathione hydrolase/gamma-glutamyltranspeptidase/glutathione hydrolase/leukotriene-C4 hydrolase
MKWLSAGRTELGDPADPIVLSNSPRIAELQSKSYAASVRANISDDTTYPWEHYNPAYEAVDPKGTSHLSVLDDYGTAVALTTTINLYWGAKVHDPQTGIVLNSEMDDFSIPGRSNAYKLEPSVYNFILPYKRPLSSTTPTIIIEADGEPGLVIGGSGGSRIVTGVFQAIVKNYLWGYGLLDTIKSPRVHHQLIPQVVYAEDGVGDWVVEGLRRRGHVVDHRSAGEASGGSVLQAVKRMETGRVEGVADWWRKGGVSFFSPHPPCYSVFLCDGVMC